ncbi:MAG TPA: hypothetical protein VGO03_19020 [Acidimicrobiia bacterium]|jgi:hypothetical protein
MAGDSIDGHIDGESGDPRSSFGNVVESIDAIIRRHPAGSARRIGSELDRNEPASLPDNVVDLRSRLIAARTGGGYPDDAA